MSKKIFINKELSSECDSSHCICVHRGEADVDTLEVWIHGDSYCNRRLVINRKDILSEKVIKFLNSDAYEFIKEVKRINFWEGMIDL